MAVRVFVSPFIILITGSISVPTVRIPVFLASQEAPQTASSATPQTTATRMVLTRVRAIPDTLTMVAKHVCSAISRAQRVTEAMVPITV